MLPMGYNTVIDFRGVVQNKLYVDKNAVDEPIDDLSAPVGRPLRAGAAAAGAFRRGDSGQSWRMAAARHGRRQLHPLRVRRSPHDVRGAVEPGVDEGAH